MVNFLLNFNFTNHFAQRRSKCTQTNMNIENKQRLIKFCSPDVSAAENHSLFPCFLIDSCNNLFESELVSVFPSCSLRKSAYCFGLLYFGGINKLGLDSVVYFDFRSGLLWFEIRKYLHWFIYSYFLVYTWHSVLRRFAFLDLKRYINPWYIEAVSFM